MTLLYNESCIYIVIVFLFQYVVIPTRRASAEAFQILVSHAFGDGGSPYIIGKVSCYMRGLSKCFEVYFDSCCNCSIPN